jgi:uncharacterized cupin superfamily protein
MGHSVGAGAQIRTLSVGEAELTPWEPDLTGVCDVLEGPLEMKIDVLWTAPDRSTANGVWQCEPSTIRLVHPYDETFVVVEGRMTFTPAGGEPKTLQAGDVIVIPRGAENVIEVHERVTKVWTIHSADGLEL